MNWYQLLKRLNKQQIGKLRNNDVVIRLSDVDYKCKIVFDNGTSWHLELDDELNNISLEAKNGNY